MMSKNLLQIEFDINDPRIDPMLAIITEYVELREKEEEQGGGGPCLTAILLRAEILEDAMRRIYFKHPRWNSDLTAVSTMWAASKGMNTSQAQRSVNLREYLRFIVSKRKNENEHCARQQSQRGLQHQDE